MAEIRLEPCYRYRCPDCGHENIVANLTRELEIEEGQDVPEIPGIDLAYYEAGPIVPEGGPVVCAGCDAMHIVADSDEDDN